MESVIRDCIGLRFSLRLVFRPTSRFRLRIRTSIYVVSTWSWLGLVSVVLCREHFVEHAWEVLDALDALIGEGLLVAVEGRHALENCAMKSFVNSIADEAQEVNVNFLVILLCPVTPGGVGECEILSAGVLRAHLGLKRPQVLLTLVTHVYVTQLDA